MVLDTATQGEVIGCELLGGLTSEFTSLRDFLRRSGGMIGWASHGSEGRYVPNAETMAS